MNVIIPVLLRYFAAMRGQVLCISNIKMYGWVNLLCLPQGCSASKRMCQIFISYSGKDREIVDAIIKSFDGTECNPVLMEDREWKKHPDQPNWLWIKNQILQSQALFVILSKGRVAQEHTQNWVAFEIGVAAGCSPLKPVYAITGENVKFPVPYLKHYFPYSMTGAKSGKILWKANVDAMMKMYIRTPCYVPDKMPIRCHCCRTEFYMHGIESEFECPCCFVKLKNGA